MANSHFNTFDEKNELVFRVLATENIWELRENLMIQRKYEEPPVSPIEPIDIETNIQKWNESSQLSNSSPDSHLRNTKFNAKPNDKENTATKTNRRRSNFKSIECGFCKNNGESSTTYNGHRLKDDHGRVICPRLRSIICPICHDTGEKAHTIKYCPNDKKIVFHGGFRL